MNRTHTTNPLKHYSLTLLTVATVASLSSCTNYNPSLSEKAARFRVSNADSQTAEAQENPDTVSISFGIYTADKPTTLVKQLRPLLNEVEAEMSENMGKPVKIKMKVANSYEKGIEDIATGKVDFSRLGPASYVEAQTTNPNLSILAIESKEGEKVFYGIIAVNENSHIYNVEQLRDESFAFGNELSTIGRFLSQQYLLKHGIVASDLSRYEYLGRHDKVGTSVGLGRFDAGALKEGTFKKLVAKEVPIREIARFPNVNKPWVGRSGLPEDIQAQLRKALLETRDPQALDKAGIGRFIEGSNEDYEPIRSAIEDNARFFE
ncbi:PhnD/SsuA/transferrin family substrate-binding protein [Lusitaniella coriacea]|uniref:PhnD/SsuA/transferrin family substrate-binding protein n=1 Tax=Lusitaniella coriacea TaxID=1983105 RepID=UPI003CE94CF3